MRKHHRKHHLLRGAIAATILSAGPALADEDGGYAVSDGKLPLEAGVSIWTRYELRDGYDELGVSRTRFIEGDWIVYRARLTLASKALRIGDSGLSTKVVFSPQVSGFWGDQPNTISTPDLGIYEGYLRLMGASFRLDVGRFALNYGDALVVGDLRWHQTARSFDGARLRFGDKTWLDGFVTMLDEGLRQGFTGAGGNALVPSGNPSIVAGDVIFGGIYASLGNLIGASTVLEPYLLSQIWVESDSGARPAVQATAGIRFKQKLGIVDLRAEAGVQFGRRRLASGANPEVFAYQADAEIGFLLGKGFRLSLEGLIASGDEASTADTLEAWDELFPTTHKFLGLMDVIGIRSNVASGVLHAKYGLGPWLFKLDLHGFLRPETAMGQQSYAGFEADLNAVYKITKGMSIRTLYAVFVPGSSHFLGGTTSDRIAHYVEVQYGLQI